MFTQDAIKNNDIKVKSVKMIIRGDILKDNLYKMNISLRKPFVKAVKFKLPKTYIGADQRYVLIDILKELNVKNVLMVVGRHVMHNHEIDDILNSLNEIDIKYEIFTGVRPDPDFNMVEECRTLGKDAEAIVAIGGGSVIDVAKVTKALVKNDIEAKKMVGMFKANHKLVPLIAIPTTAGTGSEVTLAAVISDENHLKHQVLDPRIVPEYAILDPVLSANLSLSTSYNTAFDALSHALEAYVSKYADEKSCNDSKIAIKLIFDNLLNLEKHPEDLEIRTKLLKASYHAGLAFTRVYIGYVHAFAHALAAKTNISHGLANAILLPKVMRYYLDSCQKEFADLAKLLDQDFHNELNNARFFVDSLEQLAKKAKIQTYVEGFKISDIDEVIDLAFKECHMTYPVPKYYSRIDAYNLLLSIVEKD